MGGESGESTEKDDFTCANKISHHPSNASLHYLVKCLCSKLAMLQS